MEFLWCPALPMTSHSSDMDSLVPAKPLPTKTTILWVKTWNSHSHKVNATYTTEILKWCFYDVLHFQWRHTHLIWTRLFREDLFRQKRQFLVKIMKLTRTQSKRDMFNWDPLMVFLRCSAIQMTPHSSDMISPVPRRPLPTKTAIYGENHEIYIRTK